MVRRRKRGENQLVFPASPISLQPLFSITLLPTLSIRFPPPLPPHHSHSTLVNATSPTTTSLLHSLHSLPGCSCPCHRPLPPRRLPPLPAERGSSLLPGWPPLKHLTLSSRVSPLLPGAFGWNHGPGRRGTDEGVVEGRKERVGKDWKVGGIGDWGCEGEGRGELVGGMEG